MKEKVIQSIRVKNNAGKSDSSAGVEMKQDAAPSVQGPRSEVLTRRLLQIPVLLVYPYNVRSRHSHKQNETTINKKMWQARSNLDGVVDKLLFPSSEVRYLMNL